MTGSVKRPSAFISFVHVSVGVSSLSSVNEKEGNEIRWSFFSGFSHGDKGKRMVRGGVRCDGTPGEGTAVIDET